eukprot:CAMPEP_0176113812 /NCGR_PEP_ID=MMETSP0120_2-20121206/57154_1 /TAXON_ID=160619 /ORGANISM="Kryptoperidinium foliaceum, Strain CCMP 1326" /LENGTH=476 /DNA_ID=CAMNT_0017448041 /DNA_START=62 /DNA_END=1492 /DNA_ORIENTATION=-
MALRTVAAGIAVALVSSGAARADDIDASAFAAEDECSGGAGSEACAMHALQFKAGVLSEAEGAVTAEEMEAAIAEAEQLEAMTAEAEAACEEGRQQLEAQDRYNSSAAGGLRAPAMATTYDGIEDRRATTVKEGWGGVTHIFAIGDWGATMPGHYTAPNTRGIGHKCPENCQYVHGIDNKAQELVANVMRERAGTSNPQYVLNVGDSFYWGGVEEKCGGYISSGRTSRTFGAVWSGMYGGLTHKPWISCLGNHDYGGRQFNNGWPQQIGYSFVNHNWIMPARYFTKTMYHTGYTVEYFIIDTNAFDAKDPEEDPEHNICSREHNPPGASCSRAGGPSSVDSCKRWFWSSYAQQKGWLSGKLASSMADWQIVITHFPCGTDAGYFRHLHTSHGLDLLVTGHRHDQELWAHSGLLGGMTCIVTGGGGGVTSEHPPSGMSSSQYGFFDLSMSKEKIGVQSIALDGHVLGQTWVYPKGKR